MAGTRVKWTLKDLDRMVKEGTIRSYKVLSGNEPSSTPKKNKFGAKKVVANEITFDSTKEYNRWRQLQLLEQAGIIRNLRRQVVYNLGVGRYTADHVYINTDSGTEFVEDVKSPATRKLPDYRLRKKLMKERHGIDIHEV